MHGILWILGTQNPPAFHVLVDTELQLLHLVHQRCQRLVDRRAEAIVQRLIDHAVDCLLDHGGAVVGL